MVGIGTAASIFSGIISIIRDSNDIRKDLMDAKKQFKYITTNGSMTRLLSKFIIEPVAIVSKDLMTEQITDKTLEANINIFTGYYAQVFKILTDLNGVDAELAIDVLSTDTLFNSHSKESHTDYVADLMSNKEVLSIEEAPSINVVNDKGLSSIINKEVELEVNISRIKNGKKETSVVRIPIVIKLYVVYASNETILSLIDPYNKDKTFSNRLDDFRSGAISLSDLIFANDLIKQYKKNRIKDKESLNELINNRKMSANAKGAMTGVVGFEKYYNMLIISDTTRRIIEGAVRGNIHKDVGARDTIFNGTSSLMITHVDQDHERVNIYTKDIAGSTSVSFKSLSKGDKSDFSDIIKLFMNNRPPLL